MSQTQIRTKVSRGTLEKETLLQAKTEKIEMTLNTDNAIASGLLIQRLTELYEDPIEASVRETVSNALDAVTEFHSGDNPEIKITSPNTLNPIFIVSDNGIGMSYEDLKDIYSKYGASTKMDNMDQIGAYGLGAKAPLAYGTEFTVTSVKNGERTTIIVVREELTNYIKIVDSEKTDAPSGTTVSIPVNGNDIEHFVKHIEGYRNNPIDKVGVKLLIDNEEVKDSNYMEIADDMVIFEDSEGPVYGRLWVKKDVRTITNIMSNITSNDVRQSLEYLIGGWKYKNPASRGYYQSREGIMVELKAGIVSFNSSRDAILRNDRYGDLEELVVKYISSNDFIDKIITAVNKVELPLFKSIVISLIQQNARNIHIENDEIKLEISRSYRIDRKYSISDFVHEESKFRIDDIFSGIPEVEKPTAIVEEVKESYRNSVVNYTPSEKATSEDGKVTYKEFVKSSISDLNVVAEKIMKGSIDTESLQTLMLRLALVSHNETNLRVTFITDVDVKDEEGLKNYRRTRAGRKSIINMRNEGKLDNKYSSYVIYTSHSKGEMEKMIKAAGFDEMDLKIYNVNEAIEKISEYRKNNRKATVSKGVNSGVSTEIYKFVKGDRVTIQNDKLDEEFKKDKVNIIVLSGRTYVGNENMRMIRSWYCNENDKEDSEVEVYVSIGQHRKVELNILRDLGELYEYPCSSKAGHSKMYSELLKGKTAGMHVLSKKEDNLDIKSLARIMSSHSKITPSATLSHIKHTFLEAAGIAKIADFEMPEVDKDKLDKIGEIGDKRFVKNNRRGRDWSLDYDTEKQLLGNLSDRQKRFIEDTSAHLPHRSYRMVIKDDNEYEIKSFTHGLVHPPTMGEINVAYEEENKDSPFHNLVRSQTEAYLQYVKSAIEKLSLIKS